MLSPKQAEVLRMLAAGSSEQQIAVRLGISVHTVRWHRRCILAALDARTTAHAVSIWLKEPVA